MNSVSIERQVPGPLVETDWLAERLNSPDLRIVDCSVIMHVTSNGERHYGSGRANWMAGHIPGSVFVDILSDLGPSYSPAVPLMAPLDDFAAAMEACGVSDGNQVVLYDSSNHAWAESTTTAK